MILWLCIHGPTFVGPNVTKRGRRWPTWPDCYDELLGQRSIPNVVYTNPLYSYITSRFRMGQTNVQTYMPLRWFRWTFFWDPYMNLSVLEFTRHMCSYVLFLIGRFLLPDTSCSKVHLQYLPLLEDLDHFNTLLMGGVVLTHLCREFF